MVKTEIYTGTSTYLDDCTMLCVIEGVLYDCNKDIESWIKDKDPKYFTKRFKILQNDYISAEGITRRIIFPS
jgi:hypothetical protein